MTDTADDALASLLVDLAELRREVENLGGLRRPVAGALAASGLTPGAGGLALLRA